LQSRNLAELFADLRVLIKRDGRSCVDLVLDLRAAVLARLGSLDAAVEQGFHSVQQILLTAGEKQRAEKIIASLDYPERTLRKEAIPEREENTFTWILNDNNPQTVSTPEIMDQADSENGVILGHRTRGYAYSHHSSAPSLKEWLRLQDHDGLFWIKGSPASGKSTIMKFAQSHQQTYSLLKTWAGDHKLGIAEHFFWIAGSPHQRSELFMLRNLCYQLLK
jgi:hypothetical protein